MAGCPLALKSALEQLSRAGVDYTGLNLGGNVNANQTDKQNNRGQQKTGSNAENQIQDAEPRQDQPAEGNKAPASEVKKETGKEASEEGQEKSAQNKKTAGEGGKKKDTPKNRVIEYLKQFAGKVITNKATGIKAVFNTDQINKMVSNTAVNKSLRNGYSQDQHLEAARNIRQLFEDSYLSSTDPDKNNDQNIKSIKRFKVDTTVEGENATALITVKESVQHGHRIYSVELEKLEKPVEKGERAGNVPSTDLQDSSQKGKQASTTYAGESSNSNISQTEQESKSDDATQKGNTKAAEDADTRTQLSDEYMRQLNMRREVFTAILDYASDWSLTQNINKYMDL